MNCPRCFGKGVLITTTKIQDPEYPMIVTHRENCPDCHGTGIIHCCEGDRTNDEK